MPRNIGPTLTTVVPARVPTPLLEGDPVTQLRRAMAKPNRFAVATPDEARHLAHVAAEALAQARGLRRDSPEQKVALQLVRSFLSHASAPRNRTLRHAAQVTFGSAVVRHDPPADIATLSRKSRLPQRPRLGNARPEPEPMAGEPHEVASRKWGPYGQYKTKPTDAWRQHVPAPADFKIKEIVSNGHRYYVGSFKSGKKQGTFGRFEIAWREDGTVFGLKKFTTELALYKPPKQDAAGRAVQRTATSKESEVLDELNAQHGLGADHAVHDVISIDGKMYGVVTAHVCSLHELIQVIPSQEHRVWVTKWALACLAKEVANLHLMHHKAHRDIKAGNALCTDDGRIILADFGAFLDLDPYDIDSPLSDRSNVSTYPGPETAPNRGLDMWAIGVTLLEIMNPSASKLLHYSHFKAAQRASYEAWWLTMANSDGSIDLSRMPPLPNPWTQVFWTWRETAPATLRLTLRGLLVPHEEGRSDLFDIMRTAVTTFEQDDRPITETQKLIADYAAASRQSQAVDILKKYAEWRQRTRYQA
jgi:hypothetical protein